MNKKSTSSQSAFFSPGVLIALLLCAAVACSILVGTLVAFYPPKARTKISQATLTFAERVSYQRAIEEVYWRHRIWPKGRADPKPSLDAVVSQAQLEKKVADYLRNSQALEDYWQRPLSAEQLQAEMDRMAKNTKQPEVLRELFEALGNDPFVIAECLARPALAERLLTNWYASDDRIHGELKQRAEAELQVHPTIEKMKQLVGKYSEIELIKSSGGEDEHNRSDEHGIKLNSREWDETLQRLAAMSDGGTRTVSAAKDAPITQIRTGVVGPLQEDENHYYARAVINKADDRLKLATVSWRKEPAESWIAKLEDQVPRTLAVPDGSYTLPTVSGDTAGCTDDTWGATSMNPPRGRINPTAVWTGSEMIVWGGFESADSLLFNTGGRYNPSTDTWIATSNNNAPAPRTHHTAVWTGTEMIIWGGNVEDRALNTGGRYNPTTNSWTATSTTNAPYYRAHHAAVWTGTQMIIWGGSDGYTTFNTGGRYNPSTNT